MRNLRRKVMRFMLALIITVSAVPGGMFEYGKAFAAIEFSGDGTFSNPYLISTGSQLNKIRGNYLNASYYFKLTTNIDLRGFAGGTGWVPIGTWDHPFIGHMDGDGYKITGLKIADSSIEYGGLFGYVGEIGYIANIKLENVNINAGNWIGGLVAVNAGGTIENSSASGSVVGTRGVGGLAGSNVGTIRNSYAVGSVRGSESVGGLAGINGKEILNSYATVDVSGSLNAGGLVGWQSQPAATIMNSHADGNVSGSENVGGLVGWNYSGAIAGNSHATGTVSGIDAKQYIGGLVGYNEYGSISDSYTSGDVSGQIEVGGLIGYDYGGIINNSYTSGNISGSSNSTNVGGLIGRTDYGMITKSYSSSDVAGSNDIKYAGGLIGYSLAGTVSNSYATGDVAGYSAGGLLGSNDNGEVHSSYAKGNVNGTEVVGGLAGWNVLGPINNSYASGKVNGTEDIGGLVGWNVNGPISNSYATGKVSGTKDVGGLIGFTYADTTVNSFYDDVTTGQSASQGGLGKPTPEMLLESTYEADQANRWDFTNIWAIAPNRNGGYPYLREIQVYLNLDGNGNDGGTVPPSLSYMPGSNISINTGTSDLTKAGYVIDGWNMNADGSGNIYRTGDSYTITSTTTLFANWVLPSLIATLTSGIGTVSPGGTASETIADIPNGITLAALKAAITPSAGATFEIYDADGTTVATTLTTGKKIIVTSHNGNARTEYTVILMNASSDATLTSTLGTVSAGGTADETITDIPYGTPLISLIKAITPAHGAMFDVYDADEVTLTTGLTRDKKVVVTAEDGITEVVYALKFVPNTIATMSSTIGKVSTGGTENETFLVPYGTTLTALKAAITPADGATLEVYDADGTTVATAVTTGKKVIVTAEDGMKKTTYLITIAPNTDTRITSSIGVVSTGGTANETISSIPFGTTLAAFKAAITPAAGATFEIYNNNGTTVATSLQSGRKAIVTAQDGITKVTYLLTIELNSDATMTSTIGTVSTGGSANETITVPYGTTYDALYFAIKPAVGAQFAFYQADGTTVTTTLATGTKIVITSQDTLTKVTYTVTIAANSAKDFTAFSFAEQSGTATINKTNRTIAIKVVNGTNLNGLVATFTLSAGATAKVGGTNQASGTTVNNFATPVIYEITASDGSMQNWTVTVTVAASSAKAIASFSFAEQTGPAVIDANAHTVAIQITNGTNPNGLVATFAISAGATAKVAGTIQVSGTTTNNFTSPLTYLVTAADNSTQNWKITVSIAVSNAKAITSFSFAEQTHPAVIDATSHTIAIEVANGTNPNGLVATFAISAGATAKVAGTNQVSGTTTNNFTSPVTYLVTAADNSTQNWTVTLTVKPALSSAATLTSTIGTVSTGGTVSETLMNVPYGTMLAALKEAIMPAANATFEVYDADGTTVATTLATGMKVIVTAEDGTTKVTYTIGVMAAPPSAAATLTSTIGTVSAGGTANETITNIPHGTTVAELKAAITPAAGALLEVYTVDGTTVATDLASGYKVIITAEDGTTKVTYTLTVTAAPPSAAATLMSTIGTVSTGGTANETITNIPHGTTLAELKAAITTALGATFEVNKVDGTTVATDLASGYKVIVTAEDGTTKVTYTLTVTAAPPSAAATLTSTIGTVSAGGTANETIANVPHGTTLAELKAAITTASGAKFEVYKTDGTTVATDLASGYKVIVTAEDGTTKLTYTLTVTLAPASGGFQIPGITKVFSTDGRLDLHVGEEGEVSLEKEVIVSIPANAINKEIRITIDKIMSTSGLLAMNDVLASAIFEILKNIPDNFTKPVTLSFKFDPASLKNYQKAAVFYYDEGKKIWIEVTGSKINGNYITVTVNHFTKFAVFAVGQAPDLSTETEHTLKMSDIAGHWAEPAIVQAVNQGIVTGYPDGTFKPNHIVTRAEFTVMLVNHLKPQGSGAALTFSDTSKIGAWARSAVAQAVQDGYIKGYKDGTFRPNEAITRAEMTVMIANALHLSVDSSNATGFADEKNIPSWAKGAVTALRKLGYIQGSGLNRFNPNDKTTRAEAVTVLLKLLAPKSD